MKISPAYAREYREWIGRGLFEDVYRPARAHLAESLRQEHPALMAMDLHSIATCYYTRGAVALLDEDQAGWRDIQCGYWAALYRLRFELKAALPAWSRRFYGTSQVELVLTFGLAKLFQQDGDASWLSLAVSTHFKWADALGELRDGTLLLQSILEPDADFSYENLLKDRGRCCMKRDAWPKRPTEIRPFGILDIEAMLRFPEEASFHYPASMGFEPTDEEAIIESVTAFHSWYE